MIALLVSLILKLKIELNKMLISIGEILVDIFFDEKGRTTLPGGAPFNVASNATLYTQSVGFIGAVGNDENGKLLRKTAENKPFKYLNIKVLNDSFTSEAIVTLTNGERDFRFNRDGGADYQLSLEDVDFSLIKKGDIIHIGSLLLSYETGVKFYKDLVKKIRTLDDVKISFDINFRSDIFPSLDVAKKVFIDALEEADILKFSIDELYLLSEENSLEKALKKLVNDKQIAVVTLGDEGSIFYKDGRIHKVSSIPVKPVDTTGAGDAFYSYFLASLINHPEFVNDDKLIQKYLFRSNIVGAIATLKKGAINVAPSESEIDEIIRHYKI